MALTDARAARVLTTALLFALGLGFLYITRRTLIAFLFAVFFAYLVDPAVSHVERWTRSRGLAVGIIYFLLLLLVISFFFSWAHRSAARRNAWARPCRNCLIS